MPDYEYVHTELAKPYVTLNLLWEGVIISILDSLQSNTIITTQVLSISIMKR